MPGIGITERIHDRMVAEAAEKARHYQVQRYTQEDVDKITPIYREGILNAPVSNKWGMTGGTKPPCKQTVQREADLVLESLGKPKTRPMIERDTGLKKNNVERAVALLLNQHKIELHHRAKSNFKTYIRTQDPE